MNSSNHRFTIIALTETWTNSENEPCFNIPGYISYIKSRSDRSGGGVALYVDENVSFTIRSDLDDPSCSNHEHAFIKVCYKNIIMTIGVIYRPPNTDLIKFNSNYNNLLSKLSKEKSKCYIAGDFNINLLNYETHSATNEFLDNTFSNCLYPVITQPTIFCNSTGTLIDNIFIDNTVNEYLSGIFLTDISDHLPVFYIDKNYTLCSSKTSAAVYQFRTINDSSIAAFIDRISQYDWNLPQGDNININVIYN